MPEREKDARTTEPLLEVDALRVAFRTRDVLDAMRADAEASGSPGADLAELKVDGGACANDLLMQFQADILGVTVRRPVVRETTALGAAALAGLAVGIFTSTQFAGAFLGAAAGGWAYGRWGLTGIVVLNGFLITLWFIVALGMKISAGSEAQGRQGRFWRRECTQANARGR